MRIPILIAAVLVFGAAFIADVADDAAAEARANAEQKIQAPASVHPKVKVAGKEEAREGFEVR